MITALCTIYACEETRNRMTTSCEYVDSSAYDKEKSLSRLQRKERLRTLYIVLDQRPQSYVTSKPTAPFSHCSRLTFAITSFTIYLLEGRLILLSPLQPARTTSFMPNRRRGEPRNCGCLQTMTWYSGDIVRN